MLIATQLTEKSHHAIFILTCDIYRTMITLSTTKNWLRFRIGFFALWFIRHDLVLSGWVKPMFPHGLCHHGTKKAPRLTRGLVFPTMIDLACLLSWSIHPRAFSHRQLAYEASLPAISFDRGVKSREFMGKILLHGADFFLTVFDKSIKFFSKDYMKPLHEQIHKSSLKWYNAL